VDALCILRRLGGFGPTTACPATLAMPDTNFDGQVTATDALCVLRFVGSFIGSANCPLSQSGAITITMTVTENREPGLTGSFTLTPLTNNQLRVDVTVTGLPPNGQARAAHIHGASGAHCDTGVPVLYGLTSLTVDGTGRGASSTTVTLTPGAPIQAGNAYLNVHNPALGGVGVICGNIPVSFTASG